jgi:sec-independent protein translocase protein TatA
MDDLIWIVIAVVVLFGGSQLPKLARNAGEAMKEFRKGHADATPVGATTAPAGASVPPAQAALPAALPAPMGMQATPVVPAVPVAPVVPVVPATAPPAFEDRVTLTRAELDALLADREARTKTGDAGTGGQA